MAEVKILVQGYTNAETKNDDDKERTCATISLVCDGNLNIVVDPGVLDDQRILVDALRSEGLEVGDIDLVVLTHSHFDHFRNVGMFAKAKVLVFWGLWDGNTGTEWDENISDDIKVLKTPGHSSDSLSLVVKTEQGVVLICGDVFWKENEPIEDPYADDAEQLKESRKKILEIADYIVPGHGGMFKVKR